MSSYLIIFIAYIAGSIPIGLAIGKVFFKKDIREHGSGNIGASNVKRVLGAKAAFVAFVFDVLKGFLPVLAARHFYPHHPWIQVLTGLAAIMGHNNSVFLKFTGGKGVATSCGVAIAFSIPAVLIGAATWTVITFASGFISLGSVISAPVTGFLIWKFNHYSAPYGLFGLFVTISAVYTHRGNIKRLLAGTELNIRDKAPKNVTVTEEKETVNSKHSRLILASASPRRKELLAEFGLQYEIIPSSVDEQALIESFGTITPQELVQSLAQAKASDVYQHHPDAIVIGADTVVVVDGDILGKPIDKDDAHAMLSRLSGRDHEVYTGIAVVGSGFVKTAVEATKVTFKPWTSPEISTYIGTGEPMDKAGAYGIQNRESSPVHSIEGDYYNVVGLPLEVIRELLLTHIPNLSAAPPQPTFPA